MFSNNGKISGHQAVRLLILDIFTGAALFLPMALPKIAGEGGFAALLLGLLLTLADGLLIRWCFKKYGRGNLESGKRGGILRWLRWLYGLRCFAAFVFLLDVYVSVLNETFLYSMPRWLIIAGMTLVLLYGSTKGIEVRARLSEILFYIVLIPVIVIGLFSIPEGDITRLMVFSSDGILWGMLVTWVLMAPLEWILYAAPEILEEEPFSVFVKALGIGGFLTGLIYVLCVTVLTVGGMAAEHWPTVILMQIVKIPGGFMTRQDGLMLSFWIFAMFIPLSGALSYTSELWGKADGTGRCRNIRLLGIVGALLAWKAESGFYSAYFWWMLISGLVLLWLCPLFLRILKNGGKTGRKRRILWIMMLTLIVTAGCTGCERYVALENRAFVMALSVDEGTEATYAFTYTFPDLEALTGNGESTKYEPVTLEADSLLEAEDKYDSMSGKSLDYGQVKVLVIGSDMISDDEKLEKLFEEIRENPEFSRTVKVCQSLTSGREILMLDEDIPGSVGIYIEEMFENNGEHLGIPTVILNDVISGYSEEDIKNLLPKIGVYDEKPRFLQ